MKALIVAILLSMPALTYAATTAQRLQAIADNAEVANGLAEVTRGTFSDVEAQKLVRYWKNRWDNCTFSKPYVDAKALSALQDYSEDTPTIDAIKKLQKDKLVSKIYGFETDHDISCSQIWINVYTKDGYVLELWYGLGD